MEENENKGSRRFRYRTEENWRNSGNTERSANTSTYNRGRNTYRPKLSLRNPIEQNDSNRRGRSFEESNKGPVRKYGKSRGFMFLEDLSKKDPEEIHSTLLKEREGLLQLLETNLSPDTIVLLVKVLKKLCSSFSSTKYTIFRSCLNDKFINALRTFVACLPTQDAAQRRNNSYFWKDPNDFWINLVEISEDVLKTTPTFGCKSLPLILTSMKIYIPIIEQELEIQVPDDIKEKVSKLIEVIQTLSKENEKKQSSVEEQEPETIEPPDDFRQISVYPSAEEVVGGRGFLRENIVKGPYRNVDQYLDVQFRLLREDFVGPLRDGIANYRSSTPSNHLENVRVHKGVRFLNRETVNENYCVRVLFGAKKSYNHEHSKRFMFGSLICFTKDNFKTLIFGKVAQRKVEDLEKGQLIVSFDEKLDIDFNTGYLMVECNVYFEPYFHVLTVLKNMTKENFPLERYIIRVDPAVLPPEYLRVSSGVEYIVEDEEFDPLSDWPSENFYNFDHSQLVAFKAAITQEITVIQGPPGTGKTYVGLKIVETLLKNRDYWYERTPLLVICFTNHALDQFLEGLLHCTDNIIRVGGQSKNTKLDRYNLRYRTERDSAAVTQQRLEVQRCLKNIKQITEILEQIGFYNSVLAFSAFEEVIPNFSRTWFSGKSNSKILHWLLEGAEYGQNPNLEERLNMIQVQAEFDNSDMSDDKDNDDHTEADNISNFDNIFDEICQSTDIKSGRFFLITLKSMREELNNFEKMLAQLRQEESPTFDQLVKEETLYIQVMESRKTYEYLKRQLMAGRQMQDTTREPKGVNVTQPFQMAFQDRWNLYFYWLNLYKKHESDVLKITCEDFPEIYKIYERLRDMEDVRAMKKSLVVGMTTTSAARLRSSLQSLKNPIVVVEEAAEMLEAHIVTSITKHCKQLILIGDDKQLKPNTANYSMEKQYRLGISLFERMLINNIHCYTLNVQRHRMRPAISCLIRPNIYPLREQQNALGKERLLRCQIHEDQVTRAKCDTDFLAISEGGCSKKCDVLLKCGHQCASLCHTQNRNHMSYKCQQQCNKKLCENDETHLCKKMCYEECGSCTYLVPRTLSCGHTVNIECHIDVGTYKCHILVSTELPCGHTTDRPCFCDPVTFRCPHICDVQVEKCGHACELLCHIRRDPDHLTYKCQKPCTKFQKNCTVEEDEHRCRKKCYQECDECMIPVRKQRTICPHFYDVPCSFDVDRLECEKPCTKVLKCGHNCRNRCNEKCQECQIKVDKINPTCGHIVRVKCNEPPDRKYCNKKCPLKLPCGHPCFEKCNEPCTTICKIKVNCAAACGHMVTIIIKCNMTSSTIDPKLLIKYCKEPCRVELQCGHVCSGSCGECLQGRIHKRCDKKCGAVLVCDYNIANGNAQEIEKKRLELRLKFWNVDRKCAVLKRLYPNITNLLMTMHKRIQVTINIFELHSLKSKLQVIEHIVDILCSSEKGILNNEQVLLTQVNFIINALSRDTDSITDQEIEDIIFEINRLSRLVEFDRIEKSPQYPHYATNNETAKRLISDIKSNIFMFKQFSKEDNERVKNLLKELNSTMSVGIAISESEKREILKAMGFGKGHWYKCPNGHVYCISECGTAMQESRCNECGAKIGGTRNSLLRDNAVATEMDSALRTLWFLDRSH